VLDAETANLSGEHTAAVERQVLDKAPSRPLDNFVRPPAGRCCIPILRRRANAPNRLAGSGGCGWCQNPMGWPPCPRTFPQPTPLGCSRLSTITPGGRAVRKMSPQAVRDGAARCRRGGGVDVRVIVPYTTLLGVDDLPGELAGYGPIPADVARERRRRHVAADSVRPGIRTAHRLRHSALPTSGTPCWARAYPGCDLPVSGLSGAGAPL
jgi:hypothetical protein